MQAKEDYIKIVYMQASLIFLQKIQCTCYLCNQNIQKTKYIQISSLYGTLLSI